MVGMVVNPTVKSILKGFVVVESIAFGPVVVGLALSSFFDVAMLPGDVEDYTLGVALLWSLVALPHFSIQPHLWPHNWDIAITLCQWGLVGLVVGRLAVNRGWAFLFLTGIASVAIVSAAVHLLIRSLGYRVLIETL